MGPVNTKGVPEMEAFLCRDYKDFGESDSWARDLHDTRPQSHVCEIRPLEHGNLVLRGVFRDKTR